MHLKVIDDSNIKAFNSKFKKGIWIILYYADWCGHCQNLKPTWNEYVESNVNNKALNIAEIPDTSFGKLASQPMTNGFPSIKMFNNQKEVDIFSGDRSVPKFERFSNKNINKILSELKKNSSLVKSKKKNSSLVKSKKKNSSLVKSKKKNSSSVKSKKK